MLYTVIVPVARVGKIILLPLSYMATTCWHSGANVNVNMCEGNVRFKTILFYRHKIYWHICISSETCGIYVGGVLTIF